jgi:hypothetical protein
MGRIRQIKPEFYLDDELAQCSIGARLLFPGLWILADRKGRLEDRPAKIKVQIFPYDADVTVEAVQTFLEQLEFMNFIQRYTIEGRRYIQIRSFHKHQHCHVREAESQIPDPPGFSEISPEKAMPSPEKAMPSTGPAPALAMPSPEKAMPSTGPAPEKATPRLPASTSTSTSAYGLRERNPRLVDTPVSGNETAIPPAPASAAVSVQEQLQKLKPWAEEKLPDLNFDLELEKFLANAQANGRTFADWEAAFRKWLLDAPAFNQRAPASASGSGRPPPGQAAAQREENNRRAIAEAMAMIEQQQQGRSP